MPDDVLSEGSDLAILNSPELAQKLHALDAAYHGAEEEAKAAEFSALRGVGEKDAASLLDTARLKREVARLKKEERDQFINRNNANPAESKYGEFYLRAPSFTAEEKMRVSRLEWTVLNGNFSDEWLDRPAKPSDPILKLGAKDGPWEIELRIPQKHISQVLKAYEHSKGEQPSTSTSCSAAIRRGPIAANCSAIASPARRCPTAMRRTNPSRRSSPTSASMIRASIRTIVCRAKR